MITANVFQRIYQIAYGESTGTAFTVDIDSRQYLITARHICPEISDGQKLEFLRNGAWEAREVRVVGRGEANELSQDLIVMALDTQISASLPFLATDENVVYGQDVYFLGFPYNLHTKYAMFDGHPLPLVKKAILSGQTDDGFLLDGHNNPGFSGGPVVFRPAESMNQQFQVLGLVSGYRAEDTEVLFEGEPTELSSRSNTGIIVCPPIKLATDLISRNPIGAPITW